MYGLFAFLLASKSIHADAFMTDIVDEFSTCPKMEWFMNNLIFEIPSLCIASVTLLHNTNTRVRSPAYDHSRVYTIAHSRALMLTDITDAPTMITI